MPSKQKHKNHLTLVRKKNALGQKQIAALLGHKTADQISRYELGVKMPTLKTAIKLGIIYNVPIRTLFYGYYELCLNEVRRQENNPNGKASNPGSFNADSARETEFCTVAEKLKSFSVPEPELNKARSHIAELIKTRSARMNHH